MVHRTVLVMVQNLILVTIIPQLQGGHVINIKSHKHRIFMILAKFLNPRDLNLNKDFSTRIESSFDVRKFIS